MSQRLIICAAESRSQANRIVGHLINNGFEQDAVSILFAHKDCSGKSTGKRRSSAASAMATTAGVGALLGGAFIWLSGMGILSVPDLGSLVIAGAPLVAALGRSTRSDMAEMLDGMGLSKPEANFYETRVRQGNILISISVSETSEALAAKRIIRAIGLQNMADTAEKAVSISSLENENSDSTLLTQCGLLLGQRSPNAGSASLTP
jgi:hypothetical protein